MSNEFFSDKPESGSRRSLCREIRQAKTWRILGLAMLVLLVLNSCQQPTAEMDSTELAAYASEIEAWHEERLASLTREDGWVSLAGLFWLEEGENTFGSAATNDLVFPPDRGGERMGVFELQQGEVTLHLAEGVQVRVGEEEQTGSFSMASDASGAPTMVELGSLLFHVLERGEQIGIRLKDRSHPNLETFGGVRRFAVSPDWRFAARFEPHDPAKGIQVPNVLGVVNEFPSPGAVVFEHDGVTYRIDALDGGAAELFLIFGDMTNQAETYGGGRFLYVQKAAEDGAITLDFNRAINPPCAFTPYATCPLPPRQNKLALRVEAGEMRYGDGPGH